MTLSTPNKVQKNQRYKCVYIVGKHFYWFSVLKLTHRVIDFIRALPVPLCSCWCQLPLCRCSARLWASRGLGRRGMVDREPDPGLTSSMNDLLFTPLLLMCCLVGTCSWCCQENKSKQQLALPPLSSSFCASLRTAAFSPLLCSSWDTAGQGLCLRRNCRPSIPQHSTLTSRPHLLAPPLPFPRSMLSSTFPLHAFLPLRSSLPSPPTSPPPFYSPF